MMRLSKGFVINSRESMKHFVLYRFVTINCSFIKTFNNICLEYIYWRGFSEYLAPKQ